MQNSLPKKAQSYLKKHLREKRWKQVVTVLACVVVFCTTYALILPALTMTSDTYCEKEAHQHSDECYEKVLVCGLEETEAAAVTPAHTHTDDCYDTDRNLVCGQDEVTVPEGHVHDDSCYEKILICQKEEHEHSLICYSNPDADVESASEWSNSVSKASLTGNWADDLVAFAQTQLGYAESTKNYMVTETGEMKGISRFGQWYGNPYGDWDAMFVSFCLNYAGIPQTAIPYGDDCAEWTTSLSYAGLYRSAGNYSPIKGDIVFFDYNADGEADHVGLVAEVSEDGSGFKSVEGNMADCVQQLDHYTGESGIIGYAALPNNPDYIPAASDTPDGDLPADDLDTPVDASGMPADGLTESDPEDELQQRKKAPGDLTIAVGETKTVYVDGTNIVKLRFVPELTHEYVCYSSASGDTYGYLYDENGNQLAYNDDEVGSRNFRIAYRLTEEGTYNWGVRWLNDSKTGEIPVHLEFGRHTYIVNDEGKLECICGATIESDGMCGENLFWTLNPGTGILTISGTGAMTNYNSGSDKAPWADLSDYIRTVTIDGATSIGSYAFQDCTSLESVTFPGTLETIQGYAFNGCSSLQTATFPESLTGISDRAFYNCSAMEAADLAETKITSIGSSAFEGCSSLQTATFPESLTRISDYAFRNCSALEAANLAETKITSIGYEAFAGCSSLKTVAFPDTLTSISSYAFNKCSSLKAVELPDGITKLNTYTFSDCSSLQRVKFPSQLTEMSEAFRGCTALKEVDLSQTQLRTFQSTFKNCSSLETVKFPSTLTEINSDAFSGCTLLREITIPKNVTNIGANVFSGCSNLTTLRLEAENVTIRASQASANTSFTVIVAPSVQNLSANTVKELGNIGCSELRFEGPNYLTGGWQVDFLPVPLGNLPVGEYYADEQGVLYRIDSEKSTASVAYCPAGIESYTVPKELPATDGQNAPIPVSGVDSRAFSDASSLKTLTFASPETITTLADLAFCRAVNLESINGKSTANEVLATFTANPTTGNMLFLQTKIEGGGQPASGNLETNKNNLQLTISTEKSKNFEPAQAGGVYQYYTGEAATTTITVSNPDSSEIAEGTVVRVYFQFDENSGNINYSPGTYTVVAPDSENKYNLEIVQTDVPGCYYLEFERPRQGDTISFNLNSSYPSPDSAGGNAVIWSAILTKEEKEALGNGLVPVEQYQALHWSTVPDTFPVKKKELSTGSAQLKGDGEGGVYISGLQYTIGMSRIGATLEGMGKDYMRMVDYEDVLTLPEGGSLAKDVRESIEKGTVKISVPYSGGYVFQTEAGRTFLTVTPSSVQTNYQYLDSATASLDENGNLVIRWRFRNGNLKTEIDNVTFTYKLADGTLFVSKPEGDQPYTVTNNVTATQHFMYSKDQIQNDACTATVKVASSRLMLSKTSIISSSTFGDPQVYKITASNPGALAYERLAFLTDDLPTDMYMRPADLAKTFGEDTAHQLTVTINYVTRCTPKSGETVRGIDGSSAVIYMQNSGSQTEYHGMSGNDSDTTGYEAATVLISWGTDGNLQIVAGDDGVPVSCEPTEAAIQSAWNNLGFVVTQKTEYCLKWDLRDAEDNVPPLVGGAEIQKNVYCCSKDTFMRLSNDTRNQYPNDYRNITNYAYGWDSKNELLISHSCYLANRREFYLSKNCFMQGQGVDEKTTIKKGDILQYSLNVTHQGKGQYDALPLVDHMSGSQALLAPVEKNKNAGWTAGLDTVTDGGKEYYVLSKEGTYKNVWTGVGQRADTVVVKKTETGLDTVIKWYFTDYSGNRSDTVSYRAYVCPEDSALSYTLNNECWLNDHQAHRLYATIPGWYGTTFDFDKVIVDKVGDTNAGYRYSNVSEGSTVVYRLSLKRVVASDETVKTLTITGKNMDDALPLSIEGYRWSKDNVRISYQQNSDSYTVTNGESWEITEPEAGDQQYIKWAEDFSLRFSGEAYIYVELKFPSGTPWQEYAIKYGATTLVNTFRVFSALRSVTHDVTTAAKVILQKGVYDTGYFTGVTNLNSYRQDMNFQDERLYYQNRSAMERGVRYYAAIYNAGPTNLYLTEMQDILPRGFTIFEWDSLSTETGNESYRNLIWKEDGTLAEKMAAEVNYTTTMGEDGRQHITFRFSQVQGNTLSPINYDEGRKMCYLKPGQALCFTYKCKINGVPDTDDTALNIITMPYYDFNGGGVTVDETCKIVSGYSNEYTPNNGGCEILDNGQAESLGFDGKTNDTQWLKSEVTLTRGNMKPGITKALESTTMLSGSVTQNPMSVNPTDTLNWAITTENDGTNCLTDYVLTDRMQSPYQFTGKVSYEIYKASGNRSFLARPSQDYLFTIEKADEENTLTIKTNLNNTYTLTIGGEPLTLCCKWNYSMESASSISNFKDVEVQLSITRDGEGNAVMSLYFPDESMGIPRGGSSRLLLSTNNPSSILENKQFINTCFVTPMAQVWDGTTNKGNVVTLVTPFGNGAMPSVRNSAPVTTTYGYVTGSSKQVSEVGNPDNKAACTDEPNYIVLGDKTKQFRYTLSVENSTPKAMDKLILIDGLPEVGDHTAFLASDPRFSEFKVSLAENPEFVVTVQAKDSNASTVLDAAKYTIEYSTKTEFDAEDWKGNGASWSTSAENARSIRLKILDEAGTLIPAGSRVSLSFTCKIDDPNVQPGQIAWNSFGYHYKLVGNPAELEAAPLKVGVKTPSIPELRKQVVDHRGKPLTVKKDETFSFLVYPGEALTGEFTTREEWIAALDAANTPHAEFSVTVKKGESLSESVRMDTDQFEWTQGEKYTVVELPCEGHYAFKRFVNYTANTCTLTYTREQTQVVTCENTNLLWSVELTKENTAHEPLSGAVFALYSPDESDKLTAVPTEYAGLNVALTVEHNNKTWYLTSVQTTPEDGKLNWPNLLREEYYLLEVKAPNGYILNSPAGQILKQGNETQGVYSVTVVNRSGYSLPETGGAGTHLYALGGFLLLLSAGALFLYQRIRRRKKVGTSN